MRKVLLGWLLVGSLQAGEIYRAAALYPDGKTLVVATPTALHWLEPLSGKTLRSIEREGVRCLAVSPEGKLLAVGERTIFLCEAATGKAIGKLFGHTAAVHSLVFLPGGQRLLSADQTGQVRLWELSSQKAIRAATTHQRWAMQLVVDSQGETVAVATPQGVQLFEAQTLLHRGTLRLPGSDQATTALAFSPDGRSLAALYADHRLVIWELLTAQPRLSRPASRDLFRTLAFTLDGRRLLLGGERTFVWDLSTDRLLPVGERKNLDLRALFPLRTGLLAVTEQEIFMEKSMPTWPAFSPLPIAEAWEALDQPDATRAYWGLWSLLHSKEGVAHVLDRLSDVSGEIRARRQKIQQLIADLDHEDFPVREKASAALAKLGPEVYDDLESALKSGLPLEPQRRIERLLRSMKRPSQPLAPGLLRHLRGVEVLEYAGTPEVWAVLEKLSACDEPRLAASAKAALSRRKKAPLLGADR